jgi:hypothetical protein
MVAAAIASYFPNLDHAALAGALACCQVQQGRDDNRVLPGTDAAGCAEALFRAASSAGLSLYKDCDDNDERSTDGAIGEINQSSAQQSLRVVNKHPQPTITMPDRLATGVSLHCISPTATGM